MNNILLNAINIVITTTFVIFNILITYNKDLDHLCWLLPGIIICGMCDTSYIYHCNDN